MRVTVDTTDKDFISPEDRRGIKIFLNGIEQTDVYTVDEEDGVVTKAQRDKDERVIVCNGEVQLETLTGNVVILDSLRK